MKRLLILVVTHGAVFALGFGLGVYLLPILTQERSPNSSELAASAANAAFSAELTRDLRGSDFVHWGEGKISVSASQIIHEGALSPGPDYKLYLAPSFAEDEAEFEAIKSQSVRIGDIKSFSGFILDVPQSVDIEDYNTVLVWCEAFGEFITAAQYR